MENSTRCHLRIISINDVYELDNFPHFAAAKKIESVGPTKTLAVLAGDFVAPSLLSSIDHGHAKVDCMNMSGVDYVCIGNHENDVRKFILHCNTGYIFKYLCLLFYIIGCFAPAI